MSLFAIISLILAAWYILVGIPLMMNSKDLHAMFDAYAKPTGALINTAFITLAFAVVILTHEHQLVGGDSWTWVLPLVGWLTLIKGAWIILFPENVRYTIKKWYNPGTSNMILGLIITLLGVFFLWLAYNVY